LAQSAALVFVVSTRPIFAAFFLPDFLSLDPVLQVELSQRSDCDGFIQELPVEKPGSLFECKACTHFQGPGASQEVDVLLV